MGGSMGQYIHRVGRNEQDRIRRVTVHLRQNGPEYGNIALEQLQSGFTGLLTHTCCNHHDLTAGNIRIIPGCDL